MTLNITLASRWLLAQSSDFRLTRGGTSLTDAAQKQIVLHYPDWSGLLCYTGVASFGTHDTARWLTDIVSHPPDDRSPDDLVRLLVAEGNKWLPQVPAAYRRHTFTLLTYVRSKPHVYIISNSQWAGREFPAPVDEFRVDHVSARRGPRCIVTGYTTAVTQAQRDNLEARLAANPGPASIRDAIARASRDAAVRAGGTVSETCVAAHLSPDGSGEAQVFGNLSEEFVPTLVANGTNVAMVVPDVLRDAREGDKVRLVGVTWTPNGKNRGMVAAFRPLANQTGTGWPDVPL